MKLDSRKYIGILIGILSICIGLYQVSSYLLHDEGQVTSLPVYISGFLAQLYLPLLCLLISAILMTLVARDKKELEPIIREQLECFTQKTKEVLQEVQVSQEHSTLVGTSTPATLTDDLLVRLYNTNLEIAYTIKESYEIFVKAKGTAFAKTYRLEIFCELSKTHGVRDFKQVLGSETIYVFKGRPQCGEYIGNHHYGYMGKAIGFSNLALKSAAGMVQVYAGSSHWRYIFSYFDDPADQQAIIDGYIDYDTGYRFG